jgi:hypothetical protein
VIGSVHILEESQNTGAVWYSGATVIGTHQMSGMILYAGAAAGDWVSAPIGKPSATGATVSDPERDRA